MNVPLKESKIKTFGEFQGRTGDVLVVPKYQRSFSWKKLQIDEFLNDLNNNAFISEHNFWFLGSFFTRESKAGTKEILDGQQRLTTFFILIKELMLYPYNITDENTKDEFMKISDNLYNFIFTDSGESRLILDSQNENSFSNYIKEKNRRRARFKHLVASQKLLDNARSIIRKSLEKTIIGEQISKYKKIISFVRNNIQVIDIELNEDANFNELFEGLNNRGLGLSQSDLFKNLYLLNEPDRKSRRAFDKEWFKIQKNMFEIGRVFEDHVMYYMHLSRGVNQGKKSVINYLKQETRDVKKDNKDVLEFLKSRFSKVKMDSEALGCIYDYSIDTIGDELINFYFDEESKAKSLQKKARYVALMSYFTLKNIKQFAIIYYALIQRYNKRNDIDSFEKLLTEISIAVRYYLIMYIMKSGANTLRNQATKIAYDIVNNKCSSIVDSDYVKSAYKDISEEIITDKIQFRLNNNSSVLFILFIQISKNPKQIDRGNYSKVASCEHFAPIEYKEYWSELELDDKAWDYINDKYSISEDEGFLTRVYNNDYLNEDKNKGIQNLLGNKFFLNIDDNSALKHNSFSYKTNYVVKNDILTLPNIPAEKENKSLKSISNIDKHNVNDILERTKILNRYLKESLIKEDSF